MSIKEYSRLLRNLVVSVCLLSLPMGLLAQGSISVKGIVQDESGISLPGVNVVVVGTTTGVVTSADGRFTINVPSEDAVLRFSFVGYDSQDIPVGDRREFSVVLIESFQAIEEVVVIGYGTARRSDVTGSIVSIGADAIKAVPSANAMQALQGRLAGVDMINTGNRPGDNMQVRIRGQRSLSASNDPLIVLDGIPFPGNISDINPSDIQSIDILKDASSTAIYGSRGANGVILITTNKGFIDKPLVTYDGYVGLSQMFSRYPMMNGPEFVAYRTEAQKNGTDVGSWSASDDQSLDNDWQKLVLKNSFSTSHTLSVSAPTAKGSYNFGASYYRANGIQPMQSYERISVRGSFDQQIGKILRIGMSTQNAFITTNGQNVNIMYGLLQTNPTLPAYNADGSVRKESYTLNSSTPETQWNPIMYKTNDDERLDVSRAFSSYNTFYGEVKLYDGLKYRINLGGNYRQINVGGFTTGAPGIWSGNTSTNDSRGNISNDHNINWTVENLLYYDKTFGKHTINAVAMYSAEQTLEYHSAASALGVTIDQVQYWNLGLNSSGVTILSTEDGDSGQRYRQRGLLSAMGRLSYIYDSRYMISATIRSDGASVLAPGHKWHTYPAVSVGWNIRNEQFMQNIDWLSFLKLRAGYGQTSNQSVSPYGTYGLMSSAYYTTGLSSAVQGFVPNTVPNENLGWEYSETYNFGADFALFNGRLSGTAEYYIQKTKDLLLYMTLPSSSGIPSRYLNNIGATENRGFELALNGTILENRNGWTWTAGINLYTNKNKITQLAGDSERDIANNWFVGESINAIYDYKKLGIFQLNEAAAAPGYYSGARPGTIKVAYNPEFGGDVTYDSDGKPSRVVSADDRYVIGSTDAAWQGGFNTTVKYMDFDFTMVGTFRHGGTLISLLHSPASYLNMLSGRRGQIKVDYWTENNPTNDYPMAGGGIAVRGGGSNGNADNPSYGTTLAYFSSSFLKIRTLTLGYTLRENWMRPLGISHARFYVSVNNPFVLFSPFKNETGMDPEPNSEAGQRSTTASGSIGLNRRYPAIGYDTPSLRTYIFGVNVSF